MELGQYIRFVWKINTLHLGAALLRATSALTGPVQGH